MARIVLDDLSLTFRVRQQSKVTLKEYLLKQMFRPSINPWIEVRALRNLSFALEQGQRLGIIGHNGAGKSTLLKTLAGVYPPSSGKRRVEGKICSLFDLSLGFELEASGWENIGYRSYLQGETPRTVKAKIQEIAEFSELGDFLNIPIRFYSSGMLVRLAFSIATSIEPEVLLIDEALGAGDMAFQSKAKARMRQLIAQAHLMVLVTHDLNYIQEMCDQALWLDHGCMKMIGHPEEVVAAYHASSQAAMSKAAA